MTEQHTKFEKPRGLSHITVREGYTHAHVSGWNGESVAEKRLGLLASIANKGVSIDFLKLAPDGMSFVAPDSKTSDIQRILEEQGTTFTLKPSCSIVVAHAVNIRDEEGLIARIMATAIEGGFEVEHVSDMHDRALLVVDARQANALAAALKNLTEGNS